MRLSIKFLFMSLLFATAISQAKICQEDKEKFCPGTTGKEAEKCMTKNINNWSEKCKSEYKEAMDKMYKKNPDAQAKRERAQAQIDSAKASAMAAYEKSRAQSAEMERKRKAQNETKKPATGFFASPCGKLKEKHIQELEELQAKQNKQRDAETDTWKKAQMGQGHINEMTALRGKQTEEVKAIPNCK